MSYLITGGGGFIGSNIAEKLVKRSEKIRILDNFSTGKRENLAALQSVSKRDPEHNVEIIEGDIRDLETCQRATRGVHYVLHHAAMVSVSQSVLEPLLCNAINVTGTLNMLIAARDEDVKRFVLASSSAVYGDGEEEITPIPSVACHEDMPVAPMTPYAVSKWVGENYCRIFHDLYGLETVCLRYFNVFGPRQDHASEYAAVIPKFIDALRQGRQPIVYGDGRQSRDFVFIEDVVRANQQACVAPEEAAGKVFNVANHRAITLLELLDTLKAILNVDTFPWFSEVRKGDIRHSWAENDRARQCLGFAPTVSLHDGLTRMIRL
jgi:nucleoside-diphosphate-sugar epimerase